MPFWPAKIVTLACATQITLACPLYAGDAAVDAIERARALLARRGHYIEQVVVVERWPANARSREAFVARGTIFVNRDSNVLRAAVQNGRFLVALASVLLHEQSHLDGASELRALEIELEWLTSNRADHELIQATRRSIELEKQREKRADPQRSPGR